MPCVTETLRCVLCCEEGIDLDHYNDYYGGGYRGLDDHESCICSPIAAAVARAISCLFERISSRRRNSNIREESYSSYQRVNFNYPRETLPPKPQPLPPPPALPYSESSSLPNLAPKPLLLPPPPPKVVLVPRTVKVEEVPGSSDTLPVVRRTSLGRIPSVQVPTKVHETKSENKSGQLKPPPPAALPYSESSSLPNLAPKPLLFPPPPPKDVLVIPRTVKVEEFPGSSETLPVVRRTSLGRIPSVQVPTKVHETKSENKSGHLKPPPLAPLRSSSIPSPSGSSVSEKKLKYVSVQKETAPLFVIPDHLKELFEEDIVPPVLRKGVTPSTYKEYFAALLHAEDFYIKKWSNFQLNNVTLELQNAAIYKKSHKNKLLFENDVQNDKIFVAFEIDSVPERRPFLLSRDFVHLKPLGKMVEPFQGILHRVVNSSLVLAEFGDDFRSQHSRNRKYDVSFSFNRVCLKRSHQAIAGSSHLFQNFLFPSRTSRVSLLNSPLVTPAYRNLNLEQRTAVNNISRLKDPPPYLIEGQLSVVTERKRSNIGSEIVERKLSPTGMVIKEAVLQICRTSPGCRILISAPTNSTCDMFMRSLKGEIPESDIFRANAAFRELDGVPYDILPFCPFEGECFTCPSLLQLQNYKVVLSTFVSSFRLYDNGIEAGHFSHIFLVDASSATEPEVMVVLANLADKTTVVVVTGATGNQSRWVRSDVARWNGLKISYFERLLRNKPYNSFDTMFVAKVRQDA
ncbi:hypothetical protein Sjap_014474 [Stephania japonica]|uniref:Helicase MOV-10-like beta-barrel domain-containing protein n=1 Tax=Stephania japonica TaxID=461633 RepID=A0AAP0IHM5_9MAGN